MKSLLTMAMLLITGCTTIPRYTDCVESREETYVSCGYDRNTHGTFIQSRCFDQKKKEFVNFPSWDEICGGKK